MYRSAVSGLVVVVLFGAMALAEEVAKAPERWDLRMIREAPIWKNLLVNYGYADHVKHWPERRAALEKVVREYPESRWSDDAALILACEKVGFEGDRAGGIANLRRVAERYPQGQTVVRGWSRHVGCVFDQIWLMSRGGLVFLNPDGTVRASKPFDRYGEIHPKNRERLAYFAHLEKYPRYTKDEARLIIGRIYERQRNRPQAIAVWEPIVAREGDIAETAAADCKAGAAPDGFLVKRLWRPEHTAYLSLMGYYAAEDRLDEAVETAKTFVRLCSNDGRYWRVINKKVGDFYAKHGLWREAEEQYELALAECKRYQEEIQARKKKEPELGIPLGTEYQWSEKDLVELERLLSVARAKKSSGMPTPGNLRGHTQPDPLEEKRIQRGEQDIQRAVMIQGTYRRRRFVQHIDQPFKFYYDGRDHFRCEKMIREGVVSRVILSHGDRQYHYDVAARAAHLSGSGEDNVALALTSQLGFGRHRWQKVDERVEEGRMLEVFRMPTPEAEVRIMVAKATGKVVKIEKIEGQTIWVFTFSEFASLQGISLAQKVELMMTSRSGVSRNEGAIIIAKLSTPPALEPSLFELPAGTLLRRHYELTDEQWQERIAAHPKNDSLLYHFAILLSRRGETDRAIPLMRKAMELNEQVAAYGPNLASMCLRAGDLEAAERAYVETIRRFPDYAYIYCRYGGFLYDKLKEPGRAAQVYGQGLARAWGLGSYERQLMQGYAWALEKAQRLGEAKAAYERLVEAYPRDRKPYAKFLLKRGDTEGAIVQYERYYEHQPTDSYTLVRLAELHESKKRYDKAIRLLQDYIVAVQRAEPGQQEQIIKLWSKGAGLKKAREHYEGLAGDAASPAVLKIASLLLISDLAFKEDRAEEAKAYCRKAVGELAIIREEWAEHILSQTLRTCVRRKWFDDALALFEMHPDRMQLLDLARALRREGRGTDMLALFERYLFSAPKTFKTEERFWSEGVPVGRDEGELGWLSWVVCQVLDDIAKLKVHQQFAAGYTELVKKEPQQPRWRAELGYLLWKTGDQAAAEAQFRELLRIVPEPSPTLCMRIGALYCEVDRLDDAIRYYERARQLPVTDLEVQVGVRTEYGYPPTELSAAKNWVRSEVLSGLGERYRKANRLKDAEGCYREIVEQELRRDVSDAKRALSEIWKEMGKKNEFIEELKQKVASQPDDVNLRRQLAELLLHVGEAGEAVTHYWEVLKLKPEHSESYLDLARALVEAGRVDEAIDVHRQAIGVFPVLEDPWRWHLQSLESLCKRTLRTDLLLDVYRQQLERLHEQVVISTDRAGWWISMILRSMTRLLSAQGSYEEIIALWLRDYEIAFSDARGFMRTYVKELRDSSGVLGELKRLVDADPEDYRARVLYGDVLWLLDRKAEAVAQYDAVSNQLPEDCGFRHTLANVYRGRRLPEKALAEYEKIVGSCKPGSESYLEGLARLSEFKRELKRYEEAAALYEECLKYDPLDVVLRRERAECLKALGRPLPPLPVPVHETLEDQLHRGELLTEEGKLEEAIACYKSLLPKRPTDANLVFMLGLAYEKAGQDDKAVACFEKAYELRRWTGDPGAFSKLEEHYLKDKDEAKLLALYKEAGHYHSLGQYLRRKDRLSEYVFYLEQEAKKPEARDEALFELGRAYIEASRYDDARRLYDGLFQNAMAGKGLVNSDLALAVAEGYEKLRDYGRGIAILQRCEESLEVTFRLARLFGKSDQFDKCLALTEKILLGNAYDWHIDSLAETVAEAARRTPGNRKALDRFLDKLAAHRERRQVRRFTVLVRRRVPALGEAAPEDPLRPMGQGTSTRWMETFGSAVWI